MTIKCYQYLLSPLLGNRCCFYPSCSHYAIAAITRFGILHGLFLTGQRILRCHPWSPCGPDPLPEKKHAKKFD
jgi:putative membrane protein insertion efficiency factor